MPLVAKTHPEAESTCQDHRGHLLNLPLEEGLVDEVKRISEFVRELLPGSGGCRTSARFWLQDRPHAYGLACAYVDQKGGPSPANCSIKQGEDDGPYVMLALCVA